MAIVMYEGEEVARTFDVLAADLNTFVAHLKAEGDWDAIKHINKHLKNLVPYTYPNEESV